MVSDTYDAQSLTEVLTFLICHFTTLYVKYQLIQCIDFYYMSPASILKHVEVDLNIYF